MINLLKEVGRRVTLHDLVQDIGNINKFLEPLDEGAVKRSNRDQGYFRTAMRGVLRLGADATLLYSVNDTHKNEIAPAMTGIAVFLCAYILDYYIFDKNYPGYWTKNDSL